MIASTPTSMFSEVQITQTEFNDQYSVLTSPSTHEVIFDASLQVYRIDRMMRKARAYNGHIRQDNLVYICGWHGDDSRLKAGHTALTFNERHYQTRSSNYRDLLVLAILPTYDHLEVEKDLHSLLHASHDVGEWFFRTNQVMRTILLLNERTGFIPYIIPPPGSN